MSSSEEEVGHEQRCPRHPLLQLDKSQLTTQMSFRGNHCDEILHAARDANSTIRSHYKDFIHQVGRNVFPLIIASDHEDDGHSGVGSTLTLYRANGSIITQRPALGTYYELYKTCSHFFMALGAEIGPFLSNKSVCTTAAVGDGGGGDVIAVGNGNHVDETIVDHSTSGANNSSASSLSSPSIMEANQDIPLPWSSNMTELVAKAQILRQSIIKATAMEESNNCTSSNNSSLHSTNSTLPPEAMRETVLLMLTSVIDFCNHCLSTKMLNLSNWENLNQENFPRIKQCMKAATELQADRCIRQIIEWRDNLLSPEEWKELYVVIPTVWAVHENNPRKAMFARLMHPDAETHLITSEWPRNDGEARTLLGRIVADRAIGRWVFGDDKSKDQKTKKLTDQQIKVINYSSGVDVVLDDALPAIENALRAHYQPL